MNDEQLLDEIHSVNNHSKATREAYQKAVKLYTSYTEKSLYELIVEAEEEENKGIKWKLCSLRRRLVVIGNFYWITMLTTHFELSLVLS